MGREDQHAELLRIGVGGVVPVRWDAEKAGSGTLTGWASVYNVVDQQDDVVVPGAFRKTLSDWRSGKRVVGLTLDHQNDAEGLIGKLVDAEDTAYGLKTTFAFSSTAKAQDARTKAREGILNGLSFFGPVFDRGLANIAGKSVQVLKEVGLWFVGLTPIPANDDALVLMAKTREHSELILPAPWVADMKAALAISSLEVQKAAVDALVASRYNEPAPVEDTPTSEPINAEIHDEAANYALSVIGESGPDTSPPGGEPSDSLADFLASMDATQTKSDLDALAAELEGSES